MCGRLAVSTEIGLERIVLTHPAAGRRTLLTLMLTRLVLIVAMVLQPMLGLSAWDSFQAATGARTCCDSGRCKCGCCEDSRSCCERREPIECRCAETIPTEPLSTPVPSSVSVKFVATPVVGGHPLITMDREASRPVIAGEHRSIHVQSTAQRLATLCIRVT
jgi:hypothetical protein